MKNITQILIFIALSLLVVLSFSHIDKLTRDNKTLVNNQQVLFDSIHKYKILDSLNAVKVGALELSISDLKKYRAEDAALIKKLRIDKLQAEATVKTETKIDTKIILKDSLIYKDTLKHFTYNSYWTDIIGNIYKGTITIQIQNRESLLITESLRKKRFLGIKLPIWLFGYKNKELNALSKNPNTEIIGLEYIQIKK